MIRSPWTRRLAAVASLGDETRRRLFDFVASAGHAASRDEAAAALGLPRSTASFQLDRLVQEGVLAVEFQKLGGRGGPGSGRPAKLYRAAVQEVAASVPDRNYDLAAELLVSAIEESATDGGSAREALVRAAYARGQASARAETGMAGFAEFLTAEGYLPTSDGEGGFVLLNCPFHRIADGHSAVVCAMNGAFLAGAAAGCGIDPTQVGALDIAGLRARGAALPAQCCARVGPLPAGS
ncbi:transcriptional regulator [Arthrobacter sp. AL08]|uniref:helix-turn-helix domain-containing protein n=1 Tax=Micrococcaceae TaxID=1268 RepID=UPI00249AC590|nr:MULTISPECIES: helix-turn-helix domain-containing protein [Micrococcaceae]MDI3241220.1 transcriptional regulator [Arthrobacter sp. AL05]MDI3277523.1 transcriptional regulator [Arthrobacter sp. AL08]MDJ0351122.1 transcriptional regulator [Pseudarthrobacter sp. PH31-O2]